MVGVSGALLVCNVHGTVQTSQSHEAPDDMAPDDMIDMRPEEIQWLKRVRRMMAQDGTDFVHVSPIPQPILATGLQLLN